MSSALQPSRLGVVTGTSVVLVIDERTGDMGVVDDLDQAVTIAHPLSRPFGPRLSPSPHRTNPGAMS